MTSFRLLALATVIGLCASSAAALYTATLKDYCGNEAKYGACKAYIEGVIDVAPGVVMSREDNPAPDGTRTVLGYCLPEDPKIEKVVDRVMVEVRHRQPLQHQAAARSVIEILGELYPCS